MVRSWLCGRERRSGRTPSGALAAAADVAQRMGFTPLILGDALEGESAQLGIMMAGIAKSVKQHGLPVKGPAVLLSGGETTVTIGETGCGRGGRNTEFLLALACALKGEKGITPSPETATGLTAPRMRRAQLSRRIRWAALRWTRRRCCGGMTATATLPRRGIWW